MPLHLVRVPVTGPTIVMFLFACTVSLTSLLAMRHVKLFLIPNWNIAGKEKLNKKLSENVRYTFSFKGCLRINS